MEANAEREQRPLVDELPDMSEQIPLWPPFEFFESKFLKPGERFVQGDVFSEQ
jgi:hypothetical protein